jgi:pimeloyl-ACP methyl ester carboxylesterase
MWKATAERLAKEGYRAVVPDLRGHGRSPLGQGPSTMEAMARDVAALLDTLRIGKAAIVGFSMGGYVALQVVAREMEHVRCAAFVDTRAEADNAAAREGRAATALKVREKGMQALVDGMMPNLVSDGTRTRRPEVVALLERMMRENPPAGAIAALEGLALRPDMKGRLRFFQLPALVVVGEEDRITPMEAASALAQAMSHSEYHVVPGAGHCTPLEQPEAFQRILLDWLRKFASA